MVGAGPQTARQVVGRVIAGSLAVVVATQLAGCAQSQPAQATPSSSLSPTTTSGVAQLEPHDWVRIGPYGVGNLGCGDQVLAWTTGTQPISKVNHRNDVIEIRSLNGGAARVIASAKHGGTLTDSVPITGSWLVYLEYQQHLQTSSADFWYLDAANWTTGQVIGLASATAGAPLGELPWYDAADGRAAWNQLDANGTEALRIYDFNSGESTRLTLPAGMYPVQPTISGSSVVFVDNSTDPERAHEDFLGRHGSLQRFDLQTGQVATLSGDPTAWMPRAGGGEVVWTVVSKGVVSGVSLSGGPVRTFGGSNPITPQTNGTVVVWYDSRALRFMAFGLKDGRLTELQVGNWPDMRSVFALCNNRLFFALPPALDGDSSTIRYVDLTATGI